MEAWACKSVTIIGKIYQAYDPRETINIFFEISLNLPMLTEGFLNL
jgi:hypothetical protein